MVIVPEEMTLQLSSEPFVADVWIAQLHGLVVSSTTEVQQLQRFCRHSKLGIRSDHTGGWIEIKFCTFGGLQDVA